MKGKIEIDVGEHHVLTDMSLNKLWGEGVKEMRRSLTWAFMRS